MTATEEKLPFDKGVCPTGVYITDPSQYSVYIFFAETLPTALQWEHYEEYKGKLVCIDGFDPYAFQSRAEVDQHIAEVGQRFWTFKNMEEYQAFKKAEEETIKEQRKILEAKYGVPVAKVQDEYPE